MKKQTITPDMIMEATIHYVADYGLENVTTKKVATSMGISEGTIFNNFPNKIALLTACLYFIDQQIDATLKAVPFQGLNLKKNAKEIWYCYFNFMLEHKGYARFYRTFRQSSHYTPEVIQGQDQSFSFFTKLIQKNVKLFGFNPDLYWVYIIGTTLNFAVRIEDGSIPGTPKDIEHIYNLISYGFLGGFSKAAIDRNQPDIELVENE